MTSGGREVDVGGRGPRSNNVLDFILERSNDSQDSYGSDVARIYKVYLNNLYYAQSYSPGKGFK